MANDARTMTDGPFVTVVFEDPRDGASPDSFESKLHTARSADASRLGATVRTFATATLDPRAKLPAFATIFEHDASSLDVTSLTDVGTSSVGTGCFRLRNVMPGSADSCEARGMLIGITDCGDMARIDEFHRWYDECHAADVMKFGAYQRGRRFVAEASELGSFLALYETTGEEPATFKSYLAWPERDRSRCEVFVVRQVATLRRIG